MRAIPLPPAFDAGGFDCGEQELTEYLCDGTAATDEGTSVARTYLVMSDDRLVGYFTVLADAIRLATKERPKDVPYSSVPALKLGRMGVAMTCKKQGIGPWILDYVVGMARELSKQIGTRYVTLDALPRPRLVAWYTDYGFVRNTGHEDSQRILRWVWRQVSREKELDHVSMRFDILLRRELPASQ